MSDSHNLALSIEDVQDESRPAARGSTAVVDTVAAAERCLECVLVIQGWTIQDLMVDQATAKGGAALSTIIVKILLDLSDHLATVVAHGHRKGTAAAASTLMKNEGLVLTDIASVRMAL